MSDRSGSPAPVGAAPSAGGALGGGARGGRPASFGTTLGGRGADGTPENAWSRFGWLMGAVWLVFLFYPASALLESPAATPLKLLGWAGLGAFAAAYLIGFIVGMRVELPRVSGVAYALFGVACGCAALTIPALGWGITSFIPFVMSYSSYLLSRRWHWAVNAAGPLLILIEILTAPARNAFAPWPLLWMALLVATVNSINSWLVRRAARADALRIELATSEEREGVARDVHDLLGHSLTVIKLKAELAAKTLDTNPEGARNELDAIVRIATESISGVRATVSDLRLKGLTEQLEATRAALASAGIGVDVHGSPTALSLAQSIPAAWVLREATTNVLRHTQATRVRIDFAPGTMAVTDTPAAAGTLARRAPEPLREGHGIRGMRERAAAAGAELTIAPAHPAGLSVRLTW